MASNFFFGGNSEQLMTEQKEIILNTNNGFFVGSTIQPVENEEVVINTTNGFFGGNSEIQESQEEIEISTNNGFFGGIEVDSEEESDCQSGKCSEEGFFRDCANTEDFSRNGGKGKSFNFSVWNSNITYINDEFKQDFVTYNGKLYACLITNVGVVPGTTKDWVSVIKTNPIWNYI